jgi:uncharacterized HAD superfamily protein
LAGKESQFHDFLLAEYAHIADAHFKTNETISGLFQQYFTIVALPFTALVVAISLEPARAAITTNAGPSLIAATVLFLVIALIGFMVLVHMSNLRFDTLLYARSINALRKHYYDLTNDPDLASKSMMRVLPQSHLMPRYLEGFEGLMPPFVVTLTVVNTIYFFLGITFWQLGSGIRDPLMIFSSGAVVAAGVFAALHVLAYVRLAQLREDKYLHSNIMGVDIDGVLNRQPVQFCDFLERNTTKKIQVKQIVTIPVHDCAGLGVSDADEKAVFNDPTYWIEMPVADDAAQVLSRLRNSMKLKIHIFTHRPWPIPVALSEDKVRPLHAEWAKQFDAFYTKFIEARAPLQRIGFSISSSWRVWWPYRSHRVLGFLTRETDIDRITKVWLDEHGFKYDALMIEKGSEEVADPAMEIHNRFYAARTYSIRYFVEDDLVKAKKLAYICDIVFLINQPYNQARDLPRNMIRVEGWKEILKHMRQFA